MRHLTLVVLTGLLLAIGMTAQAGKVYKWQGDDGSWHYSEIPPVEKEAETLKIKVSNSAEQPSEKEPEPENPDSTKPSEEQPLKQSPEVAAAERERKAQNCEMAKKNLTSLTDRPRILYNDKEKGEERYLTSEEHDEWRQKSKDQVKEFCQ
ncbi:MAG: DUF4124 domain-containing protein [Porticoccus sp.]|nr:DUF4124 domain-containing protein [Porticoccus sp.]MBQ0807462.1 DUF4124 domain-containing protein [Porticoccus sp.]